MNLKSCLALIGGGALLLCLCASVTFAALSWYGGTLDPVAVVDKPSSTRRPVSTATPAGPLEAIRALVPTPTPAPPTVGDTVSGGGVALTLHGITAAPAPEAGRVYLVADVQIDNLSRDNGAAYSPYYFSVKDSAGYEYEYALVYIEPALHAGEMPLGDTVRGNVAFDVPLTATALTLIYDPIVIGGGYEQLRFAIGDPPSP